MVAILTINTKAFHNKARHGLSLDCEACGWKTIGGGYDTLSKRDDVEQNVRAEHGEIHSQVQSQGNLRTVTVEENGQFVEEVPSLKVTKSTHKVEAEHTFVQQTVRQINNTTTYATPTGCTIVNTAFDAGQTYLIYATAHADTGTSISAEVKLRVVHGTAAFTASESATEIDTASTRHTYMWWNVWTAVAGEDIHLEMASSVAATEVGVDQVCLLAFRLTPDLVLNTDFKHDIDNTATTLAATGDTATGNATVTITPTVAGHRWLILSKARYGTGISNSTSPQSRISRSGEASNNSTVAQLEGEDAALSQMILCAARVDTLGAVSNTYTEISNNIATTALTSITRTMSGIFIMDLDQFRTVAVNNEDTPQEAPNSSTTNYAELVHTQAITPAVAGGDVWAMAYVTQDWGGSSFSGKMRLQIDDINQPSNQTTAAYNFKQWSTEVSHSLGHSYRRKHDCSCAYSRHRRKFVRDRPGITRILYQTAGAYVI